jgi:hypothetical protein
MGDDVHQFLLQPRLPEAGWMPQLISHCLAQHPTVIFYPTVLRTTFSVHWHLVSRMP